MTRKESLSLSLPINLINSNNLNWRKKKTVKRFKPLNIRGFVVSICGAVGMILFRSVGPFSTMITFE
jgi:hypothetical protein